MSYAIPTRFMNGGRKMLENSELITPLSYTGRNKNEQCERERERENMKNHCEIGEYGEEGDSQGVIRNSKIQRGGI